MSGGAEGANRLGVTAPQLGLKNSLHNGLDLAVGWLMRRETKPWHQGEHYEHEEIDGAGDPVSAGQVLAECSALQRNRKPKLCADHQRQGKEAHHEGAAAQANGRKFAQHGMRPANTS
jgi:hypothetical protein